MQNIIRLILQKIKDNPNLYPCKKDKKTMHEYLTKRKSIEKYKCIF